MMCVTKTLLADALLISAGYAQSAVRLEFEAASVKASSPPPFDHSFCRGGPGSSDPGLFRCENFSLAYLVNWAYELGANRLSAPDWMNSTSFDISAKVPKGTTKEQLCLMLQNLLADRFKLATHHEARESPEYRLVVAKGGPKLKPAKQSDAGGDDQQDPDAPKPVRFDSAGYPTFAPGESGTRSTPHGRAHLHEPRMTMGWLAATLSGSLHATVTDATGLNGEHEIDLYWVLDSAPTAASADDESGPTLVQALQKELGLRLEKSANGTKDVLVVDHAERVPTGN